MELREATTILKVTATLYEVAAAPRSIRFLDLNAEKDPEGARRWQQRNPLYSFGPIATGVPAAVGSWGTVGYILEITTEDADAEFVYRFAKWLDENYERYRDAYDSNKYMTINHLMEALKTTYIPVHDGLIQYLQGRGLWTDTHEARQRENIKTLDLYVESYSEAKRLAEREGIEITPANSDWVIFWEQYKVDHKIPIPSSPVPMLCPHGVSN